MKKIGLSLLATVLLAACATDNATQQPAASSAASSASSVASAQAKPGAATANAGTAQKATQGATTANAGTAQKATQAAAATPKKEKYVETFTPLRDPKNILSTREVYFDYNQYAVKEDAAPLLKAHSVYQNANKATKVSLQGHADERGTAEYNLALGQKRADAVKSALVTAYGVDAAQIETTSLGKEKPAVAGSNEEAWEKNRRVEIIYSGEFKFPKK